MTSFYNQAGFYHTSVCKGIVGWIGLSHVALQVPMFKATLAKILVCKLPESLLSWRLLTSKLAFMDTKDAIIAGALIYHFRVFERRFGSKKFTSVLLSTLFISTLVEVLLSLALLSWDPHAYSGLLCAGPYWVVFSLFVPFYHDIPKLDAHQNVNRIVNVNAKMLTYLAGFQILTSSKSTALAGLAGVLAGILQRENFLWVQRWFRIPSFLANFSQRVFGWFESGPPKEGLMGATLEIQRSQEMEYYEQQLIRQQARFAARRGVGPMGGNVARARMGQGFAERLVDGDDAAGGGIWGAMHNFNQAAPQNNPLPQPSEENVRMLMDMGFPRERVVAALQRANNDINVATTILLQEA